MNNYEIIRHCPKSAEMFTLPYKYWLNNLKTDYLLKKGKDKNNMKQPGVSMSGKKEYQIGGFK
jgi:hypothetical protein